MSEERFISLSEIRTRPSETQYWFEQLARKFFGRGAEIGAVVGYGLLAESLSRTIAYTLARAEHLSDQQLPCGYFEGNGTGELGADCQQLISGRRVLLVTERLDRGNRQTIGNLVKQIRKSGAMGVEIGVFYGKETVDAKFGPEPVRVTVLFNQAEE